AEPMGHRLTDTGSKNGTLVNGMRILDGYLNQGAHIEIGSTTIRYLPSDEQVEIALHRDTRFGELLFATLESSNVNPMVETTTLLMARRAYSVSARTLQVLDEMLSGATNLRR
ncbi:MAG: hypothetical protein HYU88_09985, partial [Chloroflexi bacterium]|nr:hypothetical protein [Chloroflexota bacterium]